MPWRKQYTRDGNYLSDSHYHADQSLTVEQILVASSNIGTISVSETMGLEKQYDYMRAFGLGEVTALDFPQESPGILHPWQEWQGTEKYTVAYGQGVASTPIQLIAAVNMVANDGRYVDPKLVLATVDAEGDLHETEPSDTRQVISEQAAVADADDDEAGRLPGHGQGGAGARVCRSPARPAPATSPRTTARTSSRTA